MQLADVVETERSAIIDLYIKQMRVHALETHDMNHVEGLLSAFVHSLRRGYTKDQEAVEIAARYGERHATAGRDLRALLQEFCILRTTIAEVATLHGAASRAEIERLTEVLHASMIEAAVHFATQWRGFATAHVMRALLRPSADTR